MTDEFHKVATLEINDDILQIQNTLHLCNDDTDVITNAIKIQKSTHKIKGLAPMMGKKDLGTIASLLDGIFKKIIDGNAADGIFELLTFTVTEMNNSMNHSNYDLNEVKQKITLFSSAL